MREPAIALRTVRDADVPVFYAHQQDTVARHMAAFVSENPRDRIAFDAHWDRLRHSNDILVRTIEADGQIAGHIASFDREAPSGTACREVTYWIGQSFWGRGIATLALRSFLTLERTRPLYGRVVGDGHASRRVLEKCGFVESARERGRAAARDAIVDEDVLRLA